MIEAGHRLPDISNYPFGVFKGFQMAVMKATSRHSKRLFNIVAEANHGTPESRKAFWRDLGNG